MDFLLFLAYRFNVQLTVIVGRVRGFAKIVRVVDSRVNVHVSLAKVFAIQLFDAHASSFMGGANDRGAQFIPIDRITHRRRN